MPMSYIFGSGGHAFVVASMLDVDVRFVVREVTNSREISEVDFFKRFEGYRRHPIYIGIGNNDVRRKLFDKLASLEANLATCIASNAFIARDAHIEKGAVICPGAVVGSRAMIGQNTIVNTLSSVDHDCRLGDHSQVTVSVSIAGTVNIGENCFFGMKSAVIPNIKIGNAVKVMAGSLITKDVPDGVTVGGYPARIMSRTVKKT